MMSQGCSAEAAGRPLTLTRQRQTPPPTSLADAWKDCGPRRGPASNSSPAIERAGEDESRKVNQSRRTWLWALADEPQLSSAPP